MRSRFLIVAAAAWSLGCSNGATAPRPMVPDANGRIAFALSDVSPASFPSDAHDMISARLEGDTLVMDVRFGGGCRDHAFVLVGSTAFAESMPVQSQARLLHDAASDACRALLSRTLRADVSPLRRAYQQAYGAQGTIVIQLGGTSVSYSF